ncbi:MAG: alpha/beta hydrolase [Calditrichaeota bacterium]|nr:MAG: alpha/beta hydrolase [Calditrichota bacterium]MBL1207053.1 alpha/beta hydrolase [Calditrichota bacterium]NOG46882.1 prolyl oligopeptidase family serine peptidase [Calditrichota bacterium]
MIRKTFHVQNNSNEPINIDLRHREDAHEAPAVILVHGFKGFKNWGFFPDLADRLTMAGYVTITPNFSRNGIGYDFNTFEKLDEFAENTHTHELEDLQKVIDNIKEEKIGKRVIDTERLALFGHSRGGGTAILKAAELGDDIKCLVTWASLATFFRYSNDQIKQWKKDGFIEIENSRTKQMMRINKNYWDDLNKNKKRFDILKAAEELENPSLFIHGQNDETVSYEDSEQLHEKCSAYVKRIELIENSGHTFGIPHPIQKPTDEYLTAVELTEHWFDNYLNVL